MDKPFFSIIVPVYNVEKYLPICLDSVLRQSFADYEIVLVDDGSTDRSGQICDDYAARYSDRIWVNHKQNQGQISARMDGLKLANGDYVCFLDSDDCWSDYTLKRLHEVIEATNTDVILFRWERIDENGKSLNELLPSIFPKSGFIDKKICFEKMMSTSSLNALWSKCCKLSLFDINMDFSKYHSIRNGEDLLQCLPVLFQADTIYYLDEPLYLYRVNTKGVTHVYQNGQHRTLNIVRPQLYKYIVKLGIDSEENKDTFFRYYLVSIWKSVEAMYTGIPSREERNAALNELHTYEFVKKGKEYLKRCSLPFQTRIGLSIFFLSDNRMMSAYMNLYLLVVRIIRTCKNLI